MATMHGGGFTTTMIDTQPEPEETASIFSKLKRVMIFVTLMAAVIYFIYMITDDQDAQGTGTAKSENLGAVDDERG